MKTVFFWINEFKRGRTCTEDETRSGHTIQATTKKILEQIYDIVKKNRRVHKHKIVEAFGITIEWIYNTVHKKINTKKLSSRWAPRLLADILMAC